MTDKLIHAFGPFLPLALLYALGVTVLSLSRVGLAVWQAARITSTDLSWSIFFLQGIRADIIQVSLLAAPLLVLMLFLATSWTRSIWLVVSYVWVLLSILLLVFMEASTPSFILQYDFRPNRLFIEYLQYPREVFSTLWNGFRLPFLLGVFGSIFFTIVVGKLLAFWMDAPQTWGYLKTLIFLPVVGFFVFAGIRSTADHRAANPALFAVTQDPLVNSLIINSAWSVFHAVYNLKHEATLFLVVADHDIRVKGDALVPIKHFHIPGLILGADIEPRRIQTVASQIDLPTTLLSLMGITAEHPMIGRDLSSEAEEEPGRAFMQYGDNYCMMEGEKLVILRPQKEPVFANYDFTIKVLTETEQKDPGQARRALGYALLPSWLYRKQLYH